MLAHEHAILSSLAEQQVLVVEDEFFIADELARALSDLSVDVLGPVPTVDEALSLEPPVDRSCYGRHHLKGGRGFAVADELTSSGIPFEFATGL